MAVRVNAPIIYGRHLELVDLYCNRMFDKPVVHMLPI